MFQVLAFLLALSVSSLHGQQQTTNGEECKSTEFTAGYGYKIWYNATEIPTSDGTVMLKFYVIAEMDAHIMLAREPTAFGYEIVLGGGSNTFCDIRKYNGKFSTKATVDTKKILDVAHPVGFWVQASKETGMIVVGRNGESLPFLYWKDPEPIPVNYYSFSSWGSAICKWMFKCKPDPLVTPKIGVPDARDRIDHTKKFFTPMEQLRGDVLRKRGLFGGDPTTNAQEMLKVTLTSDFKFIHLDVMTSTLTLRGIATFEWTDNSIHWNPQHYKNISKLHLSNYELWQPELVLHNAMDPASSTFSESKVSVDNNGNVTWRPKFDIRTKCDIDLTSWPWDKHKCTMLLSTWSHKISNVFYDVKNNKNSDCFQVSHSDWRLDRMTGSYVEDSTPWDYIVADINDVNGTTVNSTTQKSLELVVEISRNTKILEKLFYVPLLLISCVWLSSFGVMPNSSSKITTICVSIIISILIIAYMTKYVPVFTEFPPDLMLGYLKLILLISMDTFISSLLITVHNRKTTIGHPPFALTRFLTTPIVARVMALPKLDSPRILVYDQLGHRPDAGHDTTTTLWDIVIVAFERIIFIIFFAMTVAVLRSVKISVTALF